MGVGHSRLRLLVPVSHVSLQADQAPQDIRTPLTTNLMRNTETVQLCIILDRSIQWHSYLFLAYSIPCDSGLVVGWTVDEVAGGAVEEK